MVSVFRKIFLTRTGDISRPSYYSLAAWKLLLYGAWLSLVVIAGASIVLVQTSKRWSNQACMPVYGCGNAPLKGDESYIQGKAIFQNNCASCHDPMKDATGPALAHVLQGREAGFLEKFLTRRKSLRKDSAILSRQKIFGTACIEFSALEHEDIEQLEQYIGRKPAY